MALPLGRVDWGEGHTKQASSGLCLQRQSAAAGGHWKEEGPAGGLEPLVASTTEMPRSTSFGNVAMCRCQWYTISQARQGHACSIAGNDWTQKKMEFRLKVKDILPVKIAAFQTHEAGLWKTCFLKYETEEQVRLRRMMCILLRIWRQDVSGARR